MSNSSLKADPVLTPMPHGNRRHWLTAGVATAAAVAGGGFAWWKFQPRALADGAQAALWAQSFQTPEGQTLEMRSLQGKPLVINFWATWCPPCVEELPLLDRFFRQNSSKGWQIVGLAIDQPSSVRTFLQKTPVSFPVGLAGLGGTELGKSLGNLTGGLPFTVVFDAAGGIAHRKMGKLNDADLAAWSALR
jgi:thiol-disulfide isomerase/thioredoxin